MAAVTIAAGPPAVATPAPSGEPHPDTDTGSDSVGTATNETPIQHENPEEAERAGDLPEVESWLADRLSDRLRGSARNLSQEEYAFARELLGEQYDFDLERHQSVADDTSSASDDRTSAAFGTAGETQREFVEAVRDYHRTYESFESAREAGEDARARRLGNELGRQAERVNRSGRQLEETYGVIESNSGREFDRTRAVIRTLTTNITRTQLEVRETFFTATRLSASGNRRVISFERPLVISGRLQTINGTPVADHIVALRAGDVVRQARTDEEGRFRLVYRPVRLPLAAQNVTVAFDPAEDSPYLESTTAVPVKVVQTQPTLAVGDWPESAVFGDPVEVRGSVTANGTPVSDVPVIIEIADQRLQETTSGPTGFRARGRLPSVVPPGEQTLTVRIPLEDRAVAGARLQEAIQIGRAETRLQIDATDAGGGEVDVEGQLVAGDSNAVAGATIRFAIDGTAVGTVRTTQTGSFATTFSVPQSQLETGPTPVTVTAAYDAEGTNLAPTDARTTVIISPPSPTAAPATTDDSMGLLAGLARWFSGLSTAERIGLGLGLGLVLVGIVVFRDDIRRLVAERAIEVEAAALRDRLSRSDREPVADVVEDIVDADDAAPVAAGDRPPGPTTVSHVLLDRAERALREDDPDGAVTTAYAAVRGTIGPELGISRARTHWEFLSDCGENGFDRETMASLHELTVDYERAAFAAETADAETAERAVASARRLAADERVGTSERESA